uniref:Uncharacterized protein n=1 Tax=Anguilla anguilla TaxID=7936 RepID=A0A0E9W4T2_ANGAN
MDVGTHTHTHTHTQHTHGKKGITQHVAPRASLIQCPGLTAGRTYLVTNQS